MSVLGAALGLIVVVLIGGPVVGVIGFLEPPDSERLRFLGGVADHVLVGFLTAYVYAVVSAYLFALFLWLVSMLPTGPVRNLLIWLLCAAYLIGTLIFFLFGLPALLAIYFGLAWLAAGAGAQSAFGVAWLALHASIPAHFLFVLLAYILADAFAPTPTPGSSTTTPGERAWRGAMIGVNAGMNLLLATVVVGGIVEAFVGAGALLAGLSIGLALAVVTFVASAMPTPVAASNGVIRLLLGWMSWLLPMNWLAITLGWVTHVLNMLSHVLLGLPSHPFFGLFRVSAGTIDFAAGTMYMEGGIASNLWFVSGGPVAARGAYNLGCFGNVHGLTIPATPPLPFLPFGIGLAPGSAINLALTQHESGHNLNLVAFGSYFHLINAVDENIFPARRGDAYAERLAEGNVVGTGDPTLPMWRN